MVGEMQAARRWRRRRLSRQALYSLRAAQTVSLFWSQAIEQGGTLRKAVGSSLVEGLQLVLVGDHSRIAQHASEEVQIGVAHRSKPGVPLGRAACVPDPTQL